MRFGTTGSRGLCGESEVLLSLELGPVACKNRRVKAELEAADPVEAFEGVSVGRALQSIESGDQLSAIFLLALVITCFRFQTEYQTHYRNLANDPQMLPILHWNHWLFLAYPAVQAQKL